MSPQRLLRRSLLVAWSSLVLVLLGGFVAPHLMGAAGLRPYIIRGGSMEPTIPLGAVVAVENVATEAIRSGDVITMRQGDRPVITHRVIRVQHASDGSIALATKGDANRHTDGAAVPASAVLGRVRWSIPLLGYLLTGAGIPGAMLSLLSGLASLLLAIRLLDEEPLAEDGDVLPAAPVGAGGTP